MNHLLQKCDLQAFPAFVKSKILQAWAIRYLQPRLALSHDAMNWLSHLPMAGEDNVRKTHKDKDKCFTGFFLHRKCVAR